MSNVLYRAVVGRDMHDVANQSTSREVGTMTTGRHSQRVLLAPRGPFRWTLAVVGTWALVASMIDTAPRHERVVGVLLACVLIAAGVLPASRRPQARRLVAGLTTLFFVLAGVVAAVSMDVAMTYVASGTCSSLLALLFTGPKAQPRHCASTA